MILDYALLKLSWWFFISALFLLFFLLGGRDFGVCILLPFLSKKDDERRLILNSISATWEGNQVWFVTAGGATFAAWPIVYASAFSGLYVALFIVLLTLILRPPGFDFRSKIADKRWRTLWDWALFSSGFVPVLVFGVALGNLLLGLPFKLDALFLSHYEGYFYQLLNPMSVCIGLAAVSLIALHGGTFLLHKVDLAVKKRAKKLCLLAGMTFILLFLLMGYWISTIPGFQIAEIADLNTALNPTMKEVTLNPGGWFNNYQNHSMLWAFPILTVIATLAAMLSLVKDFNRFSVFLTTMAIVSALLTANAALFPFILPSSISPNHSLTLWDAVSSHRTLQYMFWVTIVFLPIVLGYTFWVFSILRGKLQTQEVLAKPESY